MPGRASRLCVPLLLLPLAALAGTGDEPFAALARAHAKKARELAASPRAVAHLHRLHALRDEVADLNVLAQPYFDLMIRRSSHPEVRRAARMLLSDVEAARGRMKKSGDVLAPLGYIERFWVLGSFDNEGKAGCDTDFGPEAQAQLDLAATYPSRGRERRWRAVDFAHRDGYVDLSALLRPNRGAVAYALTHLEAHADTRVELSVGASGAFRLWVNGEKALAQDRYNAPRPDQARVQVRLRKGLNRILLKVCQEDGPFGFYLRERRASGAPVGARVVHVDAVPPLEKGPGPQPQRVPTVTELLAEEVSRSPDDAQLRADYAVVLRAYRTFDEAERLDLAQVDRAADAAPNDARLQLLAAGFHAEDHNLRRRYLARALAEEPDAPLARLAQAELELDRDHPERALPTLEALLEDHPHFARARLALARVRYALEDRPGGDRLVAEAFQDAPLVPEATREAARMSRRLDRQSEALARYRMVLALRYDDPEARRALASLLTDRGQVKEAAEVLEALVRLSPFDLHTRLRLGELLAANGEGAEGLRHFEAARALCPDEPELHEREGRTLLALGQREEAIAAFERALALRPQNPPLREALRSLQGLDVSFGRQFAFDVSALAKEADAFGGEDAVYLANYTYVRVQPSGLSSRFHQVAVKVYTQRGVEAFDTFPITYSPDRQDVRVLKVRITHPDGSVVESFGETDVAMNEPWSGMYYDARARRLSFPQLGKGDVLELQYRLEDTARENLLSDYWGDVDYVQSTAPRLRYQYIVDMPEERPLYWNKGGLPPGVKVTVSDGEEGRTLYRWNARDVAKIVPEPNMPGWAEVATTLHVSTYKTWEDVGRYWWGLVRDQLTPNEELRRTVDQALEGVDRADPGAVVRAIYNFVVTHTRYVALEFGIHGYKPYRVDRVLARRFGDCKDKASLIHAMLKVAGVDSRLVLLRMRDLGTLSGEPASLAAFNHAIVYVPSQDLYLDGTAAFYGPTELPTADRVANVLVVDPEGHSVFRTTPEAKAEDNLTRLSMEVTLAPDGSAKATGDSTVTGIHAPDYRRSYQAEAARKATFERGWAQTFPGLEVARVEINDVSRIGDPVELRFDLEIPRYSEVLPEGLRFYPFGSGRAYTQTFAPLAERRYDLVLDAPWKSTFRFRYLLPEGYEAAALPEPVELVTGFGALRMGFKVEDGAVICEGDFALQTARVEAKDYPAFRAFLGRVDQAFARKLTVTRSVGRETAAK